MKSFGAFVLYALHVVVVAALMAFTTYKMLEWFVTPITGFNFNIFQSYGLFVFASFLTKQSNTCADREKDDKKRKIRDNVEPYVKGVFVLLFGYIAHSLSIAIS